MRIPQGNRPDAHNIRAMVGAIYDFLGGAIRVVVLNATTALVFISVIATLTHAVLWVILGADCSAARKRWRDWPLGIGAAAGILLAFVVMLSALVG